MRLPPRHRALALALLAALPTAGAAGDYDASDPYYRQRAPNERGVFSYDDSGDTPWSEDKIRIPPPPAADASLPEVRLDSLPKGFRAFLDPTAVERNPLDNVLRYWILVRSGGSINLSYEGANCASREVKVYAHADPRAPDGIRPVREPRWQEVGFSRRSDYRWELLDGVLCSGTSPRDTPGVAAAVGGYYQRARPFTEYSENLRPMLP
jgi:hypothetical protein